MLSPFRVLAGLALLAGSAAAAPVFVVFGVAGFDPLTATVINTTDTPPSYLGIDFRNLSGYALLNASFTVAAAGAVTDNSAPFPNSTITAETFDGLEAVALNYTDVTLYGTELFVTEVATPNPLGSVITDPGLQALLLAPTIFDFTYATTATVNGITASYFTLNGIFSTAVDTPEPASLGLIGGLLLMAGVALRKRAARQIG